MRSTTLVGAAEAPAFLRTKVWQLVGVVLAGECGNGEARAQGGGRRVACELLHAERRASLQQYSKLVTGETTISDFTKADPAR